MPVALTEIVGALNSVPVLALFVAVAAVNVLVKSGNNNRVRLTLGCERVKHSVNNNVSSYPVSLKTVGGIKQEQSAFIFYNVAVNRKRVKELLRVFKRTERVIRS